MDRKKIEILKQGGACHSVRDYIHHFANPVRLRILCELTLGERSVSDLADAVGVRQSSVSQQLNLLRLAGLVDRTRNGSRRLYRIVDPLATETMEFIVGLAEKIVARQEVNRGSDEGECVCA